MILLYPWIWEGGKKQELKPNHHYNQDAGSLVVPPGDVVIFYDNQDRQGKKSYPFYEGTYHDLTFYGVPKKPGVIHVAKTDLQSTDLVEVGCYPSWQDGDKTHTYYKFMKVPIGDWNAPEHFWNDAISHLQIPFGVTAEVFRDANFQGGSLIFSGENENGNTHVGLPDYDYGWCVSSMRLTADAWVSAGFRLENEVFIDAGEWQGETVKATNNSRTSTLTVPVTIKQSVQNTKEIAWDIRAGVSAKAEFQFGPEVSQGTVGVEVSVEGGYGENESKTDTREVERGIMVEVPPAKEGEYEGEASASMMIREGKMEADIVRQWKNKRTGAMTETRGRVKIKQAGETRVELH